MKKKFITLGIRGFNEFVNYLDNYYKILNNKNKID